MSIIDLIKKLNLTISPRWTKKMGPESTNSKVKVSYSRGDVAGRDIHKTYVHNQKKAVELPYVYTKGTFGSSQDFISLLMCITHNLSDQFIFLDKITILGATINLEGALIKSGDSLQHTGVQGLPYPSAQRKQFLEIHFHLKNDSRFISKQELKLQRHEADGKYKVIGLGDASIKAVKR